MQVLNREWCARACYNMYVQYELHICTIHGRSVVQKVLSESVKL